MVFDIKPSNNVENWARHSGELPMYTNNGNSADLFLLREILHKSFSENEYVNDVEFRELKTRGTFVVFKLTASGMQNIDKSCEVIQQVWQYYASYLGWSWEAREEIQSSFFMRFGEYIGRTLEQFIGVHNSRILNVLRNRTYAAWRDDGLSVSFPDTDPLDTASLLSLVSNLCMHYHCPVSKVAFSIVGAEN